VQGRDKAEQNSDEFFHVFSPFSIFTIAY